MKSNVLSNITLGPTVMPNHYHALQGIVGCYVLTADNRRTWVALTASNDDEALRAAEYEYVTGNYPNEGVLSAHTVPQLAKISVHFVANE